MAGSYDRRNLNPYFHRGGSVGGGNPLPTSYRNKAFLIVMATALYAAFLHHSGACNIYSYFNSSFNLYSQQQLKKVEQVNSSKTATAITEYQHPIIKPSPIPRATTE